MRKGRADREPIYAGTAGGEGFPDGFWGKPGDTEDAGKFILDFMNFGFDAVTILEEDGTITPGRTLGDGGPAPTRDLPFTIPR